jgi:hypothetical protein
VDVVSGQELLSQLVERVDTHDRRVVGITWTPPARPFFAAAEVVADEGAAVWRPRTDSNRQLAQPSTGTRRLRDPGVACFC